MLLLLARALRCSAALLVARMAAATALGAAPLARAGRAPSSCRSAPRRSARKERRTAAACADTSRRALLKGSFALLECSLFPGATELLTRPALPGGEKATAADLASLETWRTLLPDEALSKEAIAEAAEALARADALAAGGDAEGAIEQYTLAADGVGAAQYKLWQAATLRRGEQRKALGDTAGGGDQGSVWWWGRGLRWPGWYIVAYLSGRAAYYDWKRGREEEEPVPVQSRALRRVQQKAGTQQAQRKAASNDLIFELLFVGVGGVFLLQFLLEYGLPDYV